MTARDRKWMSLSALGLTLLAADVGVFAAAVPHARAWLESGSAAAVLRAGGATIRNLEAAGARTAAQAGVGLLTRYTRGSDKVYGLILSTTPTNPGRERVLIRLEETCPLPQRPMQATGGVEETCPLPGRPAQATSGLAETCPLPQRSVQAASGLAEKGPLPQGPVQAASGADCDRAVRTECPLKCRATGERAVATGHGLPAISATI